MSIKNAKCACQGGTLMRFVQPIILSALAQSPDHGYDLLRKLGQTALWRDAKPDATGVYRVLREMEARGLISSTLDSAARGAMGKRVFAITDAGRACMDSWIDTLTDYRQGIDEVIDLLTSACPNHTTAPSACCCAQQTPDSDQSL